MALSGREGICNHEHNILCNPQEADALLNLGDVPPEDQVALYS